MVAILVACDKALAGEIDLNLINLHQNLPSACTRDPVAAACLKVIHEQRWVGDEKGQPGTHARKLDLQS